MGEYRESMELLKVKSTENTREGSGDVRGNNVPGKWRPEPTGNSRAHREMRGKRFP